jgi:hypothetical protein
MNKKEETIKCFEAFLDFRRGRNPGGQEPLITVRVEEAPVDDSIIGFLAAYGVLMSPFWV